MHIPSNLAWFSRQAVHKLPHAEYFLDIMYNCIPIRASYTLLCTTSMDGLHASICISGICLKLGQDFFFFFILSNILPTVAFKVEALILPLYELISIRFYPNLAQMKVIHNNYLSFFTVILSTCTTPKSHGWNYVLLPVSRCCKLSLYLPGYQNVNDTNSDF